MDIRLTQTEDAPVIAAVGQCVWIDTYATEGVSPSIARYVQRELTVAKMAEVITRHTVPVVEYEKNAVGYAVLLEDEGAECEIESLYVLPKFQRKGVGKLLLAYLQKLRPGRLWLSCWERNAPALAFYRLNGFTEYGEMYFELEGERHRNVLLELIYTSDR